MAAGLVLLSGVVLGFSIAAPPGPVTALSAERVASDSWLSGWLVTAGATTADGVFFVLTYLGIARLVTPDERDGLFLLGGLLLLYLAVSIASRQRQGQRGAPAHERALLAGRSPYLLGLWVGLTSPYQLGWWISVGAGMVSEFGPDVALGFFIGIVAWTLVLCTLVRAGVARYQRLAPTVAYASAALMAAFGLWFLTTVALTVL